MKHKHLVSVIITTKNEADVLDRLLISLSKQSYPQIEVIVVDNNSTDQTKMIAKKYTTKVFNAGPERSTQRNYGVEKARGKYVLILDADMVLSKNVITECVEVAEKTKNVGGIIIPEKSVAKNFWEKVKAFERSFYSLSGGENIEAARFFPIKVYKKAGGYDIQITGPEDWDLPERIKESGYAILRVKATIKHYERIPGIMHLAKKKYYYGLNSSKYLEKHGISLVNAKTIYLLRPVFYKNWKKLLSSPILTLMMFGMLTVEQVSGGLGYLKGKLAK